jgi:hypothetical protein
LAATHAHERTSYGEIGERYMDKQIFISHRSCDKKFADLLETFLTTCGIPTETIFCSSLPGNDILCEISNEIKAALQTSKLNVVLLSDAYYQSAYCQNEAGVVWYSDTRKTVFALPEINEHNMEGFLNSENKIRRMDNKDDLLAFSDILRKIFPSFITTVAGLNAKIDKLLEQYETALSSRTPTNELVDVKLDNSLEREIKAGSFSDAEKVILLYFYETQKLCVEASLLPYKSWMNKQNAVEVDAENGFTLLAEDGLLEKVGDTVGNLCEYKLSISTYRNLRKITQPSIEILRSALKVGSDTRTEKSDNEIDNLIKKGFLPEEILLLKYIMDLSRNTLYAGWQASQEIDMIKSWEEINELDNSLSQKYTDLLNKLLIRKFIEVKEVTSYGNPKEYRLSPVFLQSLQSISSESKNKIQRITEEHKTEMDELPF